MPAIDPTPFDQWQRLAVEWRQANPGRNPKRLRLAAREESDQARAAFWIHSLGSGTPRPSGQACTVCGLPTAGWCEGCYHRCGGGEPFQALCNPCDHRQKVCHLCRQAGVTYGEGHAAWEASRGASSSETAVEITGFFDQSGEFSQEETVPITFEELSRITGIPIDELRRSIDPGSFRGSGSRGSNGTSSP